jgi:hypothetical protein
MRPDSWRIHPLHYLAEKADKSCGESMTHARAKYCRQPAFPALMALLGLVCLSPSAQADFESIFQATLAQAKCKDGNYSACSANHFWDAPTGGDASANWGASPSGAFPAADQGQTANMSVGREQLNAGNDASQAAASNALQRTDFFHSVSDLSQQWKQNIDQNLSTLQTQSSQANAAGPSAQQNFQKSLGASMAPPQNLVKLYQDAGIRTRGDLLRLGPAYSDNLGKGIQLDEQLASQWQLSAQQATNAATAMGKMSGTLLQHTDNMSSLSSGIDAGARDPNSGQEITSGSATNTTGGPAPGGSSATDGKKDKAASSLAEAKSFDSLGVDARRKADADKGSGLHDRLAEMLKRGQGERAFEGQDLKPEKEAPGESDLGQVVAGALNQKDKQKNTEAQKGRPGFSMSGSETDAEIRALHQGLGDGGRSPASLHGAFGSVDISLFRRVTLSIRRCQQENCVRWQK